MKSLAYTILLALFPLFVGSASAARMIDWFDRIGPPDHLRLPLMALPMDDLPNHNVVSPSASPRTITDGLPAMDPLIVRHGINVPSAEPVAAALPCPAETFCNVPISSISITSVPTGCAGCLNHVVAGAPAAVGAPEPLPWALAGLGLVVLALVRRRRSRI